MKRGVHLQVKAGIDDGAILGRERLGKAEQERLLIAVVLVFGMGQCCAYRLCHPNIVPMETAEPSD